MNIYKRALVGIISLGIVATSITGVVFGEVNTNRDIKVMLNGEELAFDVKPIIYNDRTLVPFRAIFEALDVEVSWNGDTRTVTASGDDVSIELTIDDEKATINGKQLSLDAPPTIYNDRTLVPVRVASEAMGCEVGWIDSTSTVVINTDGGLEYKAAAENIAAGQPSAIQAHEGWMNSAGHRKNILANYEQIGIGVEFGGSYGVYYTENFLTEK